MKAIIYTITFLLLIPTGLLAEKKQHGDTVIIELNGNSKIVIITQNRADLAAIQNYDINQMIKDLNAQLEDTVAYLVIDGNEQGKEYINDDTSDDNDEGINLDLGGISIEVDPDELEDFDEDDWRRRKKISYDADRVDRTSHHFNFDLGLNNWLEDGGFPDANAPYSIKPFGSWYVGLNSINRTWVGGPLFIEWGLGVSWYNWKFENTDFRAVKTDTGIDFVSDPNQNGLKSKLTASYINAQLVPMFDFSRGRRRVTSMESSGIKIRRYSRKGIRIGLGGYIGYRLGSHTKFIYKENSNKEKDKDNGNFHLENFRYGLRGQIGWKGAEFFATYDLNEVFSSGRGPAGSPGLNAVTFGITF
jgi:hypothetical protein